MPPEGGNIRSMKRLFVQNEYRGKERAAPGANDGNGMVPVGTRSWYLCRCGATSYA